jgi:hypothetical protein
MLTIAEKGQVCTEKACATCPTITSTWTQCFSDYQLTRAGKLVDCNDPNCLQCPKFTSTCTVCNPGYFLAPIEIAKKLLRYKRIKSKLFNKQILFAELTQIKREIERWYNFEIF